MGLCSSCCRRRHVSGEREPLLPNDRSTEADDDLGPPQSPFDCVADVLAALNVGKLPSQEQLDEALRRLLRSQILSVEDVGGSGSLGEGGLRLAEDLKEVIESALQFGVEKNHDDRLQDLLFQARRIDSVPVHSVVAANATKATAVLNDAVQELPSQRELDKDARTLVRSLMTLGRVLATSSAFRVLLSDVLTSVRDIVADRAADVRRVAAHIEEAAANVEESVRPDGGTLEDLEGNTKEAGEDAAAISRDIPVDCSESPERIREAAVFRLQQAMVQAHRVPAYRDGFRTILSLLRKYTTRFTAATDAMAGIESHALAPLIWADQPLALALEDLKVLVERLASGHTLDTLLDDLRMLGITIASASTELAADTESRWELSEYFLALDAWFDRALSERQFATSLAGGREAEALYDRGRAVVAVHSDAEWVHRVRAFLREVDAVVSAMQSDRTTQRLLRSVDVLAADIAQTSSRAASAAPARAASAQRQLQRDAASWLVPRVLRALRAVPMPRVEYTSGSLDAAVDAVLLAASGSASLVPDQIRVENWSELQLDLADAVVPAPRTMQTRTRARVRVQGVRVSARNVGYYVCYRGWRGLWGYEDAGVLDVDVGAREARGQGLSADVELEFCAEDGGGPGPAEGARTESLFRVVDVRVDVPGLRFAVRRSRHWVLNALVVQPLAGPVARAAVGYVLAQQIGALLESLGRFGGRVQRTAVALRGDPDAEGGPSYEEYWSALLQHAGVATPAESSDHSSPDDSGVDEDAEAARIESHTHATLKGIVHTTTTQREPESSDPPTPDETVLAIGVGAQILPGKGGPVDGRALDKYGPVDIARDAVCDMQHAVDGAEAVAESVVEHASKVREEVDDAEARETLKERLERRRKGWRSRAFDL